MRNICSKKKKNTSRATSRNPSREFPNLSRRGLSLERFTPPIIIPRVSVVHFPQLPLSTRASLVHEISRMSSPKSRVLRDDTTSGRKVSTSDYGDGRTRILIFALAVFRVRPGVNWMLIAVDSWPYIRGTLSPSPPGGPSGPGPQVVYPHVTPLCSATTMTVPPSRATTTPLWDRRPTPLSLRIRDPRRNSPLLLQRTGFILFLLRRVLVRCSTCFFSLVAYLCRHLDYFGLYDTFSEERQTYRSLPCTPLGGRKLPTEHRSCLPSSGECPD